MANRGFLSLIWQEFRMRFDIKATPSAISIEGVVQDSITNLTGYLGLESRE